MLTAVKKVVLSPEIKAAVKGNEELQVAIAKQLNKKTIITIQRWLRADHYALTVPMVLDTIRQHLGLPQEAIVTTAVEDRRAA